MASGHEKGREIERGRRGRREGEGGKEEEVDESERKKD